MNDEKQILLSSLADVPRNPTSEERLLADDVAATLYKDNRLYCLYKRKQAYSNSGTAT